MPSAPKPIAVVPSPQVLALLTPVSAPAANDWEKLARANAQALLAQAYPDTPFKLALRSGRRVGVSLSVAWPLLPGAPGEDEVRAALACFETNFGPVIKQPVAANEAGLTPSEFRNRYGWVPALVFRPRAPTPQDRADALSRTLPPSPPSRPFRF